MSSLVNTSNKIKDSLVANVPELANIAVLIEEQKDIENEVKRLASKASGLVVIVGFAGNRNVAGDAAGPTTESVYSIMVIGIPNIANKKGKSVIDTAESIVKHVHCLNLDTDCYHELEYQDLTLINNPTYLIYQIKVKARITF